MQVSVETTSGLERRMTVQIPKDKVEKEVQVRLKNLAGKAKIQGFRPGKVPMKVIEKRYGGQVKQEVMGDLIQSSYIEALQQENLRPAGMPQIQPPESAGDDSAEMSFTATFEVYPEIKIQGLDAIKVEKPSVEIAEKDIDDMLETIRKQRKEWKEVERASDEGDQVTIDFDGSVNGEEFEGGAAKSYALEIGAKRMIPGFEEQVKGMKAGDERTIKVTFPADYQAKDLAGAEADFKIVAHKVEESVLPTIDDAFAESFGVKEGGIEAFRKQIKENMLREADQKIKSAVKQQVMDGMLDNNPMDLPRVLVDSEIDSLIQQQRQSMGLSETSQAPDIDPKIFENQARRRVSLGLILIELVKQNDIKVEPAKLRETIEEMAAGYEKPEEVLKYYYSDKERLSEIENLVMENQAVDWVTSQASVTEKKVTFKELMNPTPAG
jgi:trigger factor